jgi:hypothetical protein
MKFTMNESCEKLKKETEIGETYMKLRRNLGGRRIAGSALCVLKF